MVVISVLESLGKLNLDEKLPFVSKATDFLIKDYVKGQKKLKEKRKVPLSFKVIRLLYKLRGTNIVAEDSSDYVIEELPSIIKSFLYRTNKKIKTKDLIILYNTLYHTLKLEGNEIEALTSLSENFGLPPYVRKMCKDLSKDLFQGETLSENLRKRYENNFDIGDIFTIESGELASKRDIAFYNLYTSYKSKRDIIRKIKGSLYYPLIIMLIIFAFMFGVKFYMMPLLINGGSIDPNNMPSGIARLNAFTSIISNPFKLGTWIAIIIIVNKLLNKFEAFKRFKSLLVLKIPRLNKMVIQYNVRDFFQELVNLTNAEVAIYVAIDKALYKMGNHVIREHFRGLLLPRVQDTPMHICLEECIFIEEVYLNVIKTNEMKDNLNSALTIIFEEYDANLREALANIQTIVGPASILLAAAFIVGLILPAFGEIQNIGMD